MKKTLDEEATEAVRQHAQARCNCPDPWTCLAAIARAAGVKPPPLTRPE